MTSKPKHSGPDAEDPVPDPMQAEKLSSIKRVDLDLHSDGISHWQDEPQPDEPETVNNADKAD